MEFPPFIYFVLYFLYFLLILVLSAGGLWTILELGRLIHLPRVIGRFAAEVVNEFYVHRT